MVGFLRPCSPGPRHREEPSFGQKRALLLAGSMALNKSPRVLSPSFPTRKTVATGTALQVVMKFKYRVSPKMHTHSE